jgi:hypothetical protein
MTKTLPMAAVLLVASLPVACTDPALVPAMPDPFQSLTGSWRAGGAITIAIGIPPAFTTQAANAAGPAKTANDVVRVKLYLLPRNPLHATFNYNLAGAAYTTTGYAWAVGVDATGNNKYTISNIPISATDYIVCARAYADAAESVNITKTMGGFDYARSGNSVTVAAGMTTYSDASSALTVNIPLLDAQGAPADVNTTFTAGGALAPYAGADT